MCALLVVIALVPVALTLIVRAPWARRQAQAYTERLLAEQGITASYQVEFGLWPPRVELTKLTIAASDGGEPFLTAARATMRPHTFALLSGKPKVSEISLDSPHIRLVVKDGKLANLHLPPPKSADPNPIFHAPFDALALTDARLDLSIDDLGVIADGIDLDVSAEDNARSGTSMEIALSSSAIQIRRRRTAASAPGAVAFDDDDLCELDARIRVQPDAVLVRRVTAHGAADLDPASGTPPGCGLPATDKRVVTLAVNHFRVQLPVKAGATPLMAGHASLRAPIALAERAAALPQTDGWIALDADVHFGPAMVLPELDGHLEAHDVAIGPRHLAKKLAADFSVHQGVVKSPALTIDLAGGKVAITGIEVSPLAPGIPLKCALRATDVDFTQLIIDLGVSPHPMVSWNITEARAASLSGTIFPLAIDGDFDADTTGFVVHDRGFDLPGRGRMLSLTKAAVGAHLAVREKGVQFQNAHVQVPHSHAEGGSVWLLYAGGVQVDVPSAEIGLQDISPIATTQMAGRVNVQAFHFLAALNQPVRIDAVASIKDYVLGDMALGDVTTFTAALRDLTLDLRDVEVKKGASTYAMPSGRLEFGSPDGGLLVDGRITSSGLALQDILSIFSLDDDPRFEGFSASAKVDAGFHFASGGQSDVCGAGLVAIHASTHLTKLDLLGERFDNGDADFDFRWRDRLAGLAGAEIDVRAFALHKVRRERTKTHVGSVLGAFRSDLGGAVHGSVVIQGVPVSELQTLGPARKDAIATVSGIAQLGGTLDALTTDAEIDVSPLSFRGGRFGASKLHLSMLNAAPASKVTGRTRCGGAVLQEVAKADMRSHPSRMSADISGELLGAQAVLREVKLVRTTLSEVSGAMSVRNLDLEQVARASGAFEGEVPTGSLSGELVIQSAKQGSLDAAVAHFVPSSMVLRSGGSSIKMRPTRGSLTVARDTLTVAPIIFDLTAPGGLSGAVTLNGTATRLSSEPNLAMEAELSPIDLSVLVGVAPKLVSAKGTLSGRVALAGTILAPRVTGEAHVRGGEFTAKDLPGALTDLDADLIADAREVRIERATARYAGGTLSFTGRAPLKGLDFKNAELNVSARGVRLQPQEGVSVGVDADLAMTSGERADVDGQALPHLAGDVTVTSFDYTRPVSLASDLTSIGGGKAKRTVVDTYDPALDTLTVDLRVRARAPLRVKNNLAELQLVGETEFVAVSGTNQRVGLRGGLKSLPNGRFHLPFGASIFEIKQAYLRFDDPTRIAANVDVFAETEYRRGESGTSSLSSSARGGSLWRIGLHAYGETDNLKVDMTSDPSLSQEDIVLLLTVGMTRAEIDQLRAGALGAGAALEALSAVSGASTAVKAAIPVIDDFRFGSAYSPRTGRTEPQVTIGKRITNQVRANISTGLSEDRDLRANVQWRLSNRVSLQGSYDNVNDVSSSSVGNLGVDLRWRLEFE